MKLDAIERADPPRYIFTNSCVSIRIVAAR